jgi:uncharacterized RDD family membrane protein YckC
MCVSLLLVAKKTTKMKMTKRNWLLPLALACGFCLDLSGQPGKTADNEPQTDSRTNQVSAEATDQAEDGTNQQPADSQRKGRRHSVNHDAIVSIGKSAELKAGDSADAVVVIGSSAKVRGKTHDAVVVVFGDVVIDGGEVGDAVVAILGNIKLVNGAIIKGDAVSIGGKIDVSDDSSVGGETHEVDVPGFGGEHLQGFKVWFLQCGLKLRPLAFQVPWVWTVGGFILLLYVLVAAVFPRPVLACVGELSRRPATTFVFGVLTLVLLLPVFLILAATGVGLILVPFLMAALAFGIIVGKVAALECLGLRIGRQFGGEAKPVLGLLIGAVIIALLYLVPVVGLMTFGVLTVWALGCAIAATFSGLRKEAPEKPAEPPMGPAPVVPPTGPGSSAAAPAPAIAAATIVSEALPGSAPADPPPAAANPGLAQLAVPVPDTLAYPKAGFWERMGAAFLDIVLIGIVGRVVGHPSIAFLVALAYFAGMWTWKGTTIGGIVVGLKVVRLDGQPVTITIAMVRALGGAFSVVVLFLGILWIAWDSEKQGWHDKLAGTVVLRLPRGTPLVCL